MAVVIVMGLGGVIRKVRKGGLNEQELTFPAI